VPFLFLYLGRELHPTKRKRKRKRKRTNERALMDLERFGLGILFWKDFFRGTRLDWSEAVVSVRFVRGEAGGLKRLD
jgi:hypothetical protein